METHQLPGTLRRLSGDAGLVLVGLLAWWALPFQQPGSVAIVAGTVSLLLASVLLLSGHNARLTRRALEST
ncbi:hypothetical protein PSMK_25460 [Phycisphaera mikurensis NBRC 102666]|uniref:Uncharacterized protein n=1 Tax=Phycisphaera mikurensis (strain NBRC 102666 / KCTC 22515 / FYK2301M01) TaxID=1142394 RepID=I0IHG7_PHYMF|nr:hypothetical protein PSMK_25460 [Phycisphaera mikurensis NBRC 102666]